MSLAVYHAPVVGRFCGPRSFTSEARIEINFTGMRACELDLLYGYVCLWIGFQSSQAVQTACVLERVEVQLLLTKAGTGDTRKKEERWADPTLSRSQEAGRSTIWNGQMWISILLSNSCAELWIARAETLNETKCSLSRLYANRVKDQSCTALIRAHTFGSSLNSLQFYCVYDNPLITP